MKILYDITEGKILSYHNPDYIIDGQSIDVIAPVVKLNYVPATLPIYNVETEKAIDSWVINGDNYEQIWTVQPLTVSELEDLRQSKIPAEISKRQLNLALFVKFQIESAQIEQMIDAITNETDKKITQIEWRDGAFVSLNHPMVNAFWQSLGYSRRQLEDLFMYAKDL